MRQKHRYHLFDSKHSSFLPKPADYITHNATGSSVGDSDLFFCSADLVDNVASSC